MTTEAALLQSDDRHFRDWFLLFPVNWNWFVAAKVQYKRINIHTANISISHTNTHCLVHSKSFLCSISSTQNFTHNANCWATNHVSELCSHHIFSVWRRACFRFYEHCLSNLLILVLFFRCAPSINVFSECCIHIHFVGYIKDFNLWSHRIERKREKKKRGRKKMWTTPNWRKRNMIMIKMLEWKQHLDLGAMRV